MAPHTPIRSDRPVPVFLGLGSNLGDRARQIQEGLARLEALGAFQPEQISSFYETEPVGWDGGPWYLNAAAGGVSVLNPEMLLRMLKEAEAAAGRQPNERNAPRPLDLDLLLYGAEEIREPELVVPHPRILERAFVLWPLAEIAPDVEVAPGVTAKAAARRLARHGHKIIRPWQPAPLMGGEDAVLRL